MGGRGLPPTTSADRVSTTRTESTKVLARLSSPCVQTLPGAVPLPRHREGYTHSFSVQEEQRVGLHPDTCPTKRHGMKTLGHEGSGSPLCSLCLPFPGRRPRAWLGLCGLSGTLLSTGALRCSPAHSVASGVTLGLLSGLDPVSPPKSWFPWQAGIQEGALLFSIP